MKRSFQAVMLFAAALVLPLQSARGQAGARFDTNPQLFAVLCALHAAGYESTVGAEGLHPIRARLRRDLLARQGPAAEALRDFYRGHALSDSGANLSRYVSFALVAGPPPAFTLQLSHDQLPPDVLALDGFREVLIAFYAEARIEDLWKRVQPEYEGEMRRLQGPVAQIVLTSATYLREIFNPASPRTFFIIIEPLVGGKTNFRNYGDNYSVVISPASQLPLDEIRHAYLHFLLDRLLLRNATLVSTRKALLNYAARAPRLPIEYRDNFKEFFEECLVKAVELRLQRLSEAKAAAAIDEAERDGYVLVRPLVRELAAYEKAEPAMAYYFPDLVRGINVNDEAQRLEKMEFAAARPRPAPSTSQPATPGVTENSDVDRWLAEGERQIAAQDAAAAAATFTRVLEKSPGQPRALYGLAVATVLLGDAERAKEMFLQLLHAPTVGVDSSPAIDSRILAWSHVYLARIYDVEGNRELALSEYRAALAVGGAPEAAHAAARRGIEKGFQPAAGNREPGSQRP